MGNQNELAAHLSQLTRVYCKKSHYFLKCFHTGPYEHTTPTHSGYPGTTMYGRLLRQQQHKASPCERENIRGNGWYQTLRGIIVAFVISCSSPDLLNDYRSAYNQYSDSRERRCLMRLCSTIAQAHLSVERVLAGIPTPDPHRVICERSRQD